MATKRGNNGDLVGVVPLRFINLFWLDLKKKLKSVTKATLFGEEYEGKIPNCPSQVSPAKMSYFKSLSNKSVQYLPSAAQKTSKAKLLVPELLPTTLPSPTGGTNFLCPGTARHCCQSNYIVPVQRCRL